MPFFDSINEVFNDAKKKAMELKVSLTITSGKEFLGMGLFNNIAVMREDDNGGVVFDNLPDYNFSIIDYTWSGPKYNDIVKEKNITNHKGKDKKRGSIGGAIVGGALLGPIGAGVGYLGGAKTKSKGKSTTTGTTTTLSLEVAAPGNITLKNNITGKTFTIGFSIKNKEYIKLSNFKRAQELIENKGDKKSTLDVIKEYKELLDLGIITQEEFDKKKQELL